MTGKMAGRGRGVEEAKLVPSSWSGISSCDERLVTLENCGHTENYRDKVVSDCLTLV